MSRIEELRAQINQAAEATASVGLLEEVLRVFNSKVEYVTPAQEDGIGKGIEDINAGRFISAEDFFAKNSERMDALGKRLGRE